MAWSASKIFSAYVEHCLDGTSAFDIDDTYKVALYDNDITPDNTVASASTAYAAGQWVSASNEVSESGQWATGGVALASPTCAFSTTTITFDATDTASGSAADLANVYGCLVYDDTVSDLGVCYNYLGGANSVVNGTFTIVWSASGIYSISVA